MAAIGPPRFRILKLEAFERPVRLRLPFRFGVVTLREAPQAFLKAQIETDTGVRATGVAAELMVPKWFDKSPALSNEDNFDQLRRSIHLASRRYREVVQARSAWGHHVGAYPAHVAACRDGGLNRLVAGFGPALIDRAVLDALCRAVGLGFAAAIRRNLPGIGGQGVPEDLAGFDLPAFLDRLRPADTIAARHTVGLADALTRSDADGRGRIGDGLPESLEEAIAAYGHSWFKIKVSGDAGADRDRLAAIAGVLDRLGRPYRATLDGNEQFADADAFAGFLDAVRADGRLTRLFGAVAFIEQPIGRAAALDCDVSGLAAVRPLLVDESDDGLDVFPRAAALGYRGISSKTCKGIYRAILNAARVAHWPASAGGHFFLSAEDLTTQAGVSVQQDLALVGLLGLEHVERNGHHYVDGMGCAPKDEQEAFATAHPDLYRRTERGVRLAIAEGVLRLRSLDQPGYATAVLPDFAAMSPMPDPAMRTQDG